jgi:proton-dependent oligopeptide transporter, POT family
MNSTGEDDAAFFGHPRGLAYLAFTQVWERFSFFGMQALLALYMVNQLLLPGHIENVLGFSGFRAVVEGVFGPLTTLALASQIFGLYTGFVNLTPLLGAWLGDRVLGQRRTAILGLVLMTAGHLLMTLESAFLMALLLLVCGAGCLLGNTYSQVGNLYSAGDSRRPRGFSIYLIALNLGAFFAPLVCGTLGEVYGWHYGFGVAGIGMLVGLSIYIAGRRYLPPDRKRPNGPVMALHRDDWRAIGAIILMLLPNLIIYSAVQQAYNLVIVWADTNVDRAMLGSTFPVTWFLTFDGLMTIVGVLITIPLWRWLAAHRREPDTMLKLAIAGSLVTLAYAMLATGAAGWSPVPAFLVLSFFAVMDLSFGWIDPPTNAFVSRFAPKAVVTTMMSLNLMAFGLSNVAVGWLGRFYEPLGDTRFWELHAAVAVVGVLLALALRPLIARLLDDHPEGMAALASTPY